MPGLTSVEILDAKGRKKLTALTTYDYSFARILDGHLDIVLVGDSLGMVIQGQPHTLAVSIDEMIYHTRAVRRGLSKTHLVVDMPFLSFQLGVRESLKNAGKLVAQGGAEAVKVEGGVRVARVIEEIVSIGIPVMGHVGLTPQKVHQFGGFKIQGRSEKSRHQVFEDAKAVEAAGAYCIVLEGIPSDLAKEITSSLQIPTIGIGAGPDCDGQILVLQDMLGMNPDFSPKFVKKYSPLHSIVTEAVLRYSKEVQEGSFPSSDHSFS